MFSKTQLKVLGTTVALGLTGAANAAALTLPAEVTDAQATALVIGAGVFAIAVAIKLYKWARAAL